MAYESPDPLTFIESYGLDADVVVGKGMHMTLGQALAAESLLCPAEDIARQDPTRRLGYLANMLAAAGSLKDSDRHLLEASE